jgi:D-lyxose ketol-isomerase
VKRSDINQLVRDALDCFQRASWHLPPNPRWDVTDFGLGDWRTHGLVLVNLADEPEYCEKLMYVKPGMVTPMHYHARKKEDIICRTGSLKVEFGGKSSAVIKRNGVAEAVQPQTVITLEAGERVTLDPGVWHAFWSDEEAIIGEVSTANDDLNDNFFLNPNVGRFSQIEEDEPASLKQVGEP